MVIAVVAALMAALGYAVASVLQHQAVGREPSSHSMRPRLVLRLLARPRWLIGAAVNLTAYGFQFLALSYGSLVLVQPLMVSGLLFALPFGAVVGHKHMSRTDWLGALAVFAGVTVFLLVASPSKGNPEPSGLAWAVVFVITLGIAGILVFAAGRHTARRTMYLACATGIFYGLTAALTKTVAHLVSNDAVGALGQWQPYALMAVALLSLLVGQSAFQSGPLSSSLPVLAVVDPVVSIVIGALAFKETVNTSGATLPIELAALASMVIGIFILGTSDLVAGPADRPAESRPPS
ncbi:MAG TPA: DMT family transporter [Acidimicrobiales bacterium]|nr:DMT family transporter [Acidimicrobiales bacterium]